MTVAGTSLRNFVITSAGELGLALAIAGLLARGLAVRSRGFALYLGAVMIGDGLQLLWRETFFTHNWFVARQALYTALKFVICAEMARGLFAGFPGAERSAKALLLAVLVLTFLSLTLLPYSGGDRPVLEDLIPRASNGALWAMLALSVVALWYVVPLHPLDKSILGGFIVWGVPFILGLRLLRHSDWALLPFVSLMSQVSYVALTLYWAFRIWTLRKPTDAPRLDQLQGSAA